MQPVTSTTPRDYRRLMRGAVICAIIWAATSGSFAVAEDSPEIAQKRAADQAAQISKIIKLQVEELEKRGQDLQARQRDLRRVVRQQCGLSPENVLPTLLRLERDRFSLEIDVKLKTARRDRLTKLIAEETKRGNERADGDAVTEHLKKIVAVKQNEMAILRTRLGSKTVTQIEVEAAEADVAEAQIRLAMRKQELAKTSADASIDRLNQQLRDVSMEVTQDELRLELLNVKLAALGEVQGLLDDYKNISDSELPRVLRMLEQAQTQLSQVEIAILNAPAQ